MKRIENKKEMRLVSPISFAFVQTLPFRTKYCQIKCRGKK